MWTAIYNDGTELNQNDNGIEHGFSEIDQNRLNAFRFKSEWLEVTVDLKKSMFIIANFPVCFKSSDNNRLIYVKRVRHHIGTTGGVQATEIEFLIGYQYTDTANHKIIFHINPTSKEWGYFEVA